MLNSRPIEKGGKVAEYLIHLIAISFSHLLIAFGIIFNLIRAIKINNNEKKLGVVVDVIALP